jgi:hypothetical protein
MFFSDANWSVGDTVVCGPEVVFNWDRSGLREWFGSFFGLPHPGDAVFAPYGVSYEGNAPMNEEAERVAKNLLRSWLSFEQLKSFNDTGAFNVVGSSTGTLYRINPVVNYGVVSEKGMMYCFGPTPVYPSIPLHDQMLVQKIALENCEDEVLQVANTLAYGNCAFAAQVQRPVPIDTPPAT